MDDYTCRILTDDEMVERMVSAFLVWRLPRDFAPDAGISFTPPADGAAEHFWPTGTNLFTGPQAAEMVKTILNACAVPNAKLQPKAE